MTDPTESLIPDETSPAPALEPIAMAALDAGRMLMEAGASANSIDAIVAAVARGLGAERVDLRVGYASLAITIGIGPNGITRMRKVGHLGVNQRADQIGARLRAAGAADAGSVLLERPGRRAVERQ